MNGTYYELKLQINPAMEDLISEIFFEEFDCDGVILAEETYKDLEMTGTTEGSLRIFLRSDDDFEDLKFDIENILDIYRQEFLDHGISAFELGSWEFILEEKKTEDWSKKWKEKWDVTHVTDKIAVVPDWIDYTSKKGEIVIKLEPGCAFGTGTHQTTQLCMKALEKYLKPGMTVADIGMGSGILSILAKKLGASYVYGCDTDETVIEVAKENALKNGINIEENPPLEGTATHCSICTQREGRFGTDINHVGCYFKLGSADQITQKFDFVVANILHFVLAEIMGDLKNIMKDGGLMSLSGILDEKKQMVLDAIDREKLKIVEEIHQDQWTSFVVKN
ncbi:50S ribosomal protein L11 methyltransferase [bacterium]|nr:50S ribosomal protein L11 methyltransferase [bacterium]